MSREVKFRAKRTDGRGWVTGCYFKTPLTAEFHARESSQFFDAGLGRHCIVTDTGVAHEIDPATLGQYTGLKDKNGDGVEIYEGDIVEVVTERGSASSSTWYQRTNANHGEVTLNMSIFWDHDRWALKLCTAEERLRKMEPIGNERMRQHVHVPYEVTDRNCVQRGRVIGNIYENPELLESK